MQSIQMAEKFGKTYHGVPEHLLFANVLRQAVDDMTNWFVPEPRKLTTVAITMLFDARDAAMWMFGDGVTSTPLMTFKNVCEVLGLPPVMIAERTIRMMRPDQRIALVPYMNEKYAKFTEWLRDAPAFMPPRNVEHERRRRASAAAARQKRKARLAAAAAVPAVTVQ